MPDYGTMATVKVTHGLFRSGQRLCELPHIHEVRVQPTHGHRAPTASVGKRHDRLEAFERILRPRLLELKRDILSLRNLFSQCHILTSASNYPL